MQVISSRTSNSARSSSRPRRKGLSLTSTDRCESQTKSNRLTGSGETLNTLGCHSGLTQTSIRFQNTGQKISWLSQNYKSVNQSISAPKNIAEMPKIKFRYTNQPVKNLCPSNLFTSSENLSQKCQINRGRMMIGPQLRRIVISSSIQTKNLSKSKINTQKDLTNQINQNRQLIDSRKIEREIFEQKVYSILPQIKQKSTHVSICQRNLQEVPKASQYGLNQLDIQNHNKCINVHQEQSPYRLLVSSAKKCQSQQQSPAIKQQGSLQLVSLQKIPQVQQFNVNWNGQGSQVSLNRQDQCYDAGNNKNQPQPEITYQQEISVRLMSPQKNQPRQVVEQTVLSDWEFNTIQVESKIDKPKRSFQKSSPSKRESKRQVQKVLGQIQNQPPETQQPNSVSGRRNIKRIKEIQKRLQEIISICNNSL